MVNLQQQSKQDESRSKGKRRHLKQQWKEEGNILKREALECSCMIPADKMVAVERCR